MTTRPALVGRILSALFVACCLAAAIWFIRDEQDQIRLALDELRLSRLILSFALALVAMVAMLLSWVHVVRAFGVPINLRVARGIFPAAQLGKYLPGAVWPVVAQAGLGRRAGLKPKVMASAGVITLALSVAVALLVGGLFGLGVNPISPWSRVAAPVGAALLVTLYPPVTRRLRVALARTKWASTVIELIPTSGREMTLAVVWCACGQILLGLHIYALVPQSGFNGAGVAHAVAAYSLAAVAGVLVVFAPAGAGAREATLVLLLQPVVPPAEALVVAISSRLILVVVDLVLAASQARTFRDLMLRAHAPAAGSDDGS